MYKLSVSNFLRILHTIEHSCNKHYFYKPTKPTTSAGTSLNEPPPAPNYKNWLSNLWRPFLVVTFLNHNRHTVSVLFYSQLSFAWALYVALSSLILPLRQPIRSFTNNKRPPLQRDMALFPRAPPPVGGFGWSAPALSITRLLVGFHRKGKLSITA